MLVFRTLKLEFVPMHQQALQLAVRLLQMLLKWFTQAWMEETIVVPANPIVTRRVYSPPEEDETVVVEGGYVDNQTRANHGA